MTEASDTFEWGDHRPADPNDRTFATALAHPPEDPAAALVGFPFDGAVLGRRGAREGPRALREALAAVKTRRLGAGDTDPRVADRGDAPLEPDAAVEAAHQAAADRARQARDEGVVPVALGGDHSLTYPLVRPHAEAVGDLAVVNVDAHLDVREVHGAPNSGTSFGRLLRDGLVEGEHLAEVGVRDLATSGAYVDWARDQGVHLVPAREVREAGPGAVLDDLYRGPLADADALYLSLDVDAMDQAHAPGVSAPSPGGLTSAAFADLARAAVARAPAPVVGVDVVETAPRHDPTGRTARAAAWALAHVLLELSRGDPP